MKTDIYKTWMFIRGYSCSTDIHCIMSLHGYSCLDILYGELKTEIKKTWISIWITVDFRKSKMDMLWILGPTGCRSILDEGFAKFPL